jgi:hypothetical protein
VFLGTIGLLWFFEPQEPKQDGHRDVCRGSPSASEDLNECQFHVCGVYTTDLLILLKPQGSLRSRQDRYHSLRHSSHS